MPILSDNEILRYNRQITLKSFDFDGQEALKQSRVLIIGAGGLGCACSQYLACAGIGHLTLVDDDIVEVSNLQRQVLHNDSTVGVKKVHSAERALHELNPYLTLTAIDRRLKEDELDALIAQHSLVIDASDNLPTRNQLNRLCYTSKTPLVSGAAIRMEGQVSVFMYQDESAPCYQCLSALFADNALTCVEAGVMAPVVGIIGSMQALEAIKVLSGYGQPVTGKLLLLDATSMHWRELALSKQPHCPVCGHS